MKKAFTLVELLVVIAIVGILSGISVSSYVSIKKIRDVQVTAQKVSNLIVQARSYAISPKSQNVSSVRVNIDQATKTVKIEEFASDNNTRISTISSTPWASNITITGNPTIIFNQDGLTASSSLIVSGAPDVQEYKVSVSSNGSVDVSKY